jgi:HEPN domain-containing protein
LTLHAESAIHGSVSSATKNWVASADYDLLTASNLLKSRRYIYVVFFCHLSIEKTLKAIYSKRHNEMPPYTHNLNRLIEIAGISIEDAYKEFIDRISLQSIPTRYPSDLARLSSQLNRKVAEEHLRETKRVVKWLKQRYLK